MLLLTVDRKSAVPMYRQILERIVELVDRGALCVGDRLPPTRTLARQLGVHRSTVLRAYGELWALGYLTSRPGSYSTVRRPARPPATDRAPGAGGISGSLLPGRINWKAAAGPGVRRACEDADRLGQEHWQDGGVIDFARLSADPSLAPLDDLKRCFRSVLIRRGGDALDYGAAQGHPLLREAIARRMRAHGISVSADEILLTSGAQQGLDLVLRLLTRPGDAIALESPTYATALALFRLHRLVLRDAPMRHDGVDLAAIESLLKRKRPALLYTIPTFHNPTGITTDQPHRERLLALCEERRVPIVEDAFEEEMKYFGRAVLPIKSMDVHGIVLYAGTFSKVVFPGLRVGWLAAPREAIARLSAIQRLSCLCGNWLAQAAVARFCSSGAYEAYLRRIHKVYRKRMQTVLKGLEEHVADGAEWTRPAGGYTLWLRVRGTGLAEEALGEQLLRDGVRVAAGSVFFARPQADPHFRLSIACLTEPQILEGCRRLGRSLAKSRRK